MHKLKYFPELSFYCCSLFYEEWKGIIVHNLKTTVPSKQKLATICKKRDTCILCFLFGNLFTYRIYVGAIFTASQPTVNSLFFTITHIPYGGDAKWINRTTTNIKELCMSRFKTSRVGWFVMDTQSCSDVLLLCTSAHLTGCRDFYALGLL